MKKNICKLLFIIFLIFILLPKSVYAAKKVGLKDRIYTDAEGRGEESVVEGLQRTFNYQGNTLTKQMKFTNVPITFVEKKGRFILGTKYKIRIGTGDKAKELYVSEDKAKNTYGYQDGMSEGSTWRAVIIASTKEENPQSSRRLIGVFMDEIYTGDEYNEGLNKSIDTTSADLEHLEEEKKAEKTMSTLAGLADFLANPLGNIMTAIFQGVIGLGDLIQMGADFIQTIPLGTASDYTIVYDYNYLESDQVGPRNMFTNVRLINVTPQDPDQTQTSDEYYSKIIDVPDNNEGFSISTPIPVIPVELYTIASGRIGALDVNFLIVDKSIHKDKSAWMIFRNVIALIIRGVIYIAAGCLLTGLIWHGLNIVASTVSPVNRKNHMNAIENLGKSIFMLIGTVVVMALCIYLSKMLLGDLNKQTSSELPIRVNVDSSGYSFSTNTTGYIRYMAQISNVDLWLKKGMYSFVYLFLALRNLFLVIVMFVRMIVMFIFSILGVLIVILHVFNKDNLIPINYTQWIIFYIGLTSIQVLLAVVYMITVI